MITPNKVVSVEKSALGLAPVVLEHVDALFDGTVSELFERVSKKFDSVDQFLLTMDLLYVLGRIEVDFSTGRVINAD